MNPWQALLAPPPRAHPSVASPPGPKPPPHTYRPPSLLNPAAMPAAIFAVGAVMTCPLAAASTNALSGIVTWTPSVRTSAAAFGWYGVYVYSVAVARFATVTGALPQPVSATFHRMSEVLPSG